MKRLRRGRSKGFTLVELIVVLVILAILAALLVPALTGYIKKAREARYVPYARAALMATQTVLDEMYADGVPAGSIKSPEYQTEVQNLIDDTELSAATLWVATKVPDQTNTTSSANEQAAYKAVAACYIYQVNEGESYHVLFYDGTSWTELEKTYTSLGIPTKLEIRHTLEGILTTDESKNKVSVQAYSVEGIQ